VIRSVARSPSVEVSDEEPRVVAPGFEEALALAAVPPRQLATMPHTAPGPVAPPPLTEMLAHEVDAPSHIELVLDDQGQQLVIAVTVRGRDVCVSLAATEVTLSAAARNAASLDHALRAEGLELVELDLHERDEESEP